MKPSSVTWYSKLLALILFIALPFAGFYAGMKYQEATTSPREVRIATDSAKTSGWKTIVESDQIAVKTKYESGVLKYSGTVQVPTPCYKPKVETTVLESYPEQVQIRVSILETKSKTPYSLGVCAQVVAEKPISGEVKVSENATVSVYLDGVKQESSKSTSAKSVSLGETFSLKINEEVTLKGSALKIKLTKIKAPGEGVFDMPTSVTVKATFGSTSKDLSFAIGGNATASVEEEYRTEKISGYTTRIMKATGTEASFRIEKP